MMKRYFFAVLAGAPFILLGQDCEDVLQRAKTEFDKGHFVGISDMLQKCLHNGFSAEQRFRAYYLLTQANILLGYPEEADDSYLRLLRANPKFSPSIKNDPVELVYLSKKFTSTPFVEAYIRGAPLSAYPFYYDRISLNPYFQQAERKLNLGMEAVGGVSWNWAEGWVLGGEAILAYRAINTRFAKLSGNDEITVSERMLWTDVPLFLKYAFPSKSKKNIPYLLAGAQASFLLIDNAAISGLYNVLDDTGGTPFQSSGVNITRSRNRVNAAVLAGGGIKFQWRKTYWFTSIRITLGITQFVNEGRNYYDNDNAQNLSKNITQFRWASTFYSINYLSFSAGCLFPNYRPRKIKDSFFTRFFEGKNNTRVKNNTRLKIK